MVEENKVTDPISPALKKGTTKKTNKLERVSSGIKNLDKIIEGGFRKNSANLIVGGSGNGKSIFSIQFLFVQQTSFQYNGIAPCS